ncbi:MAG: MurT ligase domain-containing protein [Bacillota bacterium]
MFQLSLESLFAFWAGKMLIKLARWTGHGGTSLSGKWARRLSPTILRELSRQCRHGVICVTGTNGKTTTSSLLASMLGQAGFTVLHNRSGANLIFGITTAFIARARWNGRLDCDYGLIEVDEATMPQAVREMPVTAVLVTNVFRDQLDRYGELDTTVAYIDRGVRELGPGAVLALNADDPRVAAIGSSRSDLDRVYFGIDCRAVAQAELTAAADARRCANCGNEFEYSSIYYAHLGDYICPACHYRRPEPTVALSGLAQETFRLSHLAIKTPNGSFEAILTLPGLYNAYNALAAAALAWRLGVAASAIVRALGVAGSVFGRTEEIPVGDRNLFMVLIKNPTGANEVLRTLLAQETGRTWVIAINDRFADGEDVSWLWDVDFECLAGAGPERIIVSGIRAEDMAVRLKYAGVPVERIAVENELARALDAGLAQVSPGETLVVLPTYTCMLELRELVAQRGYARRYWEV